MSIPRRNSLGSRVDEEEDHRQLRWGFLELQEDEALRADREASRRLRADGMASRHRR